MPHSLRLQPFFYTRQSQPTTSIHTLTSCPAMCLQTKVLCFETIENPRSYRPRSLAEDPEQRRLGLPRTRYPQPGVQCSLFYRSCHQQIMEMLSLDDLLRVERVGDCMLGGYRRRCVSQHKCFGLPPDSRRSLILRWHSARLRLISSRQTSRALSNRRQIPLLFAAFHQRYG